MNGVALCKNANAVQSAAMTRPSGLIGAPAAGVALLDCTGSTALRSAPCLQVHRSARGARELFSVSLASAYVLLASYLGHDAPTVRQDSGGWADPQLSRIIPISMLNGLGITAFNGARVLSFNIPPEYQNDAVTLS